MFLFVSIIIQFTKYNICLLISIIKFKVQHLFYSDTTLHIEIFMISKHEHINCITTSYVGILFYNGGNCKTIHSFCHT